MSIDRSKLITKAARNEAEFAQLAKQFQSAIQAHMDGVAQGLGYDSIATAVSYAEEPVVVRFQQEGQALRQWRSLVWQYAYQELDKVKAGTRQVPTMEDFVKEMPQFG